MWLMERLRRTSEKRAAFCMFYFLVSFGFLYSTIYLSLRLSKYWNPGSVQFIIICLGVASSFINAILAFRLYVTADKDDPRRKVFFKPLFWRYWLYAAVAGLIIICIAGGEKPRDLFRLVVILSFTPHLISMSSQHLYLWIIKKSGQGIGRIIDLTCFNCVLLLILLEAGLRLTAAVTHSPLLSAPNLKAAKRISDHKLNPGALHLGFPANSQGFYDQEFIKSKAPDTFRILGLADSFGVEGVNYQNNFLTKIEDSLTNANPNANPNAKPVEVLNLSVDGLSPRGYLYLMKEYFNSYNADFALVSIFVGNDIGWLPQRKPSLAYLRGEFWYSYFVPARILTLYREQSRKDNLPALQPTIIDPENAAQVIGNKSPTFSREAFLKIEQRRLPVCLKWEYAGQINNRYNELNDILTEMEKHTAGRLLVVLIPDEFQVSDALWQELTKASNLELYDRTRPQREISEYCLSKGIKVLDLLPALRAGDLGETLYLLQDTHWNQKGHEIATREISAAVAEIIAKE